MKLNLKTIREQLQAVGSSPPPTEVTLDRYCSDADDEMEKFCECLQRCETVRHVTFSTDFLMRMEDESVLRFFKTLGHLTTVTQLSIQSTSRFHLESIPVEGLLHLRHMTNLQTLELMDMQITAEQRPFLHALAKTLQGHPALRTVRAPNFFANDYTNITNDILDPIVDSFKTIPNIEELELSGCGSHLMNGQKHVTLVSQRSLRSLITETSTTLRSLQLSFLEFTDEYFADLVPVLSNNHDGESKAASLHTLILDYHDLGSEGFYQMMKAMETNDTIKVLSLRSLRDIGCDGFAHAMKMLQFNYKIESLSVTTTPSEQAEIDLYLRMNSAGRRLLRDHKVSLYEWVDILARHSDDIDVTRHLIREVPGLCEHCCARENKAGGSIDAWPADHRGSSPISTLVGTS